MITSPLRATYTSSGLYNINSFTETPRELLHDPGPVNPVLPALVRAPRLISLAVDAQQREPSIYPMSLADHLRGIGTIKRKAAAPHRRNVRSNAPSSAAAPTGTARSLAGFDGMAARDFTNDEGCSMRLRSRTRMSNLLLEKY